MKFETTKGAITYSGERVGSYLVASRNGVDCVEIYVDGELVDRIDRRLLPNRSAELSPIRSWVEGNYALRKMLEGECAAVPALVGKDGGAKGEAKSYKSDD